jgi:uncharacterized protein YjbI with pentapeptide repeats
VISFNRKPAPKAEIGPIVVWMLGVLFCISACSAAFAGGPLPGEILGTSKSDCNFDHGRVRTRVDLKAESVLQCLRDGHATILKNVRVSGYVDLSQIPSLDVKAFPKLPGVGDFAADLRFKDFEQATQAPITGMRVVPDLVISQSVFLDGIGFRAPKKETAKPREKGTTAKRVSVINVLHGLDVTDTAFAGPMDFSNARVLGHLRLNNVTLGAGLNFDGALLFSDLELRCVMGGDAVTISFVRATFLRDVSGVCEDAAGPPSAHLKASAWMPYPSYSFYDARFEGALNHIEFDHVKFGPGTVFRRATFGSWVKFIANTFLGSADFSEARFDSGAIFSSDFERRANFLSAQFSGPLSASFSDSVFRRSAVFARVRFANEANFSGARFCLGDFQLATFGGRTNFGGTSFGFGLFDGAVFESAVGFSSSEFGAAQLCATPPRAKSEAGTPLDSYAPPYVLGLSETRFAALGDFGNIRLDGQVNLYALAYDEGKLVIRWEDIDAKYISIDSQVKSCLSGPESLCLTSNYLPPGLPPSRPLAPVLASLRENYTQRSDQWSANQASFALHEHANAWYRQCQMPIPRVLTDVWGFVSGYGTRIERNLRAFGIALVLLTIIIATARRWLEPGPAEAEDKRILGLAGLPFKRVNFPSNPSARLPATVVLCRSWTAVLLSVQVLLGLRVSRLCVVGAKWDIYYCILIFFRVVGVVLIFFSIQVFAFTTPFTASVLETLTPWGLPAVDSGRCTQSG